MKIQTTVIIWQNSLFETVIRLSATIENGPDSDRAKVLAQQTREFT